MANKTAYIGLGSNLGDRKINIDKAVRMLAEVEQIESVSVSELIETAPLDGAEQPDYLNAVAQLRTSLSPEALHQKLIEIENHLGRVREGKWSPRTIDLDLLLFEDKIIKTPELTVPHPQMHLRSFVLAGLCRLKPKLLHPVMNVPIDELAARLNGYNFTFEPDKPHLISIAGNIGVGKTTLANKLAECFECNVLFEPYDANPFMPEVYAGKNELALDSQLFFLTSRIEQLNPDNLVSGKICISDYVFEKELIYAGALLNSRQLELYEEIYRPFVAKVTTPVLVIYLRDSAQNCLERIHNRNRPYEQQIKPDFLKQLDSDYEQLFFNWKHSPVIRLSTSQLDYSNKSCIENLVNQIKFYISDKQLLTCGKNLRSDLT
jgi:deoxyguanosine kinase